MTETILGMLAEISVAVKSGFKEQNATLKEMLRLEKKRRRPGRPKTKGGVPMPDVADYGEWDTDAIEGIFGTGSSVRNWGTFCWSMNYCGARGGCSTTIYHEFTRWLLDNPRNRNFWQTGNMVVVYQSRPRARLDKVKASCFQKSHKKKLNEFLCEFVYDRRDDLLREAVRVHGIGKGEEFMDRLEAYLKREFFSNPYDDIAYSNQVCKDSIKAMRIYLAQQ